MGAYSVTETEEQAATLELRGFPRRGGFGNLIAAFDDLNPGDALLVVNDRNLTWTLKVIRKVRESDIDLARSHAFEKPENYFLYLVKASGSSP